MTETNFPITKLGDKITPQKKGWGSPISDVVGRWKNVRQGTQMIETVILEAEGKAIYMTVWGTGETEAIEWGKQQCHVYYENANSDVIAGLTVTYDAGFMENQFSCNVKKGVLVIQFFSRFKDNSPRQDYYEREFFTRVAL